MYIYKYIYIQDQIYISGPDIYIWAWVRPDIYIWAWVRLLLLICIWSCIYIYLWSRYIYLGLYICDQRGDYEPLRLLLIMYSHRKQLWVITNRAVFLTLVFMPLSALTLLQVCVWVGEGVCECVCVCVRVCVCVCV